MAVLERSITKPRDGSRHPKSPVCKPAFRRMCGTCAAFPDGVGLHALAQRCTKLNITVNGARGAGRCHLWERKTADPRTPQQKG